MTLLLAISAWPFLVVGGYILVVWLVSALCAGNGRDWDMEKITLPEVIDQFYAYYLQNRAWGAFHCAIEDHNRFDGIEGYEAQQILKHGTEEEKTLLGYMLRMSPTQIGKISKLCWDRYQNSPRQDFF